ncbi:uncharacterized protein LOC109518449 isoform X2 [Hippocampus comes]|uniref:uncharacterized protein LOC109518449 isoform X2 n=1 Tax=Hippocampus comes TaxID=109280 RepID=UPI00094E91B9|nr:PREDICTED: uncharacterized protein LOC109518449 isoform X2 [Hippocampus comes]
MEGVQPFVSLIEFYFEIGLKYKDIKSVLDVKYGFQISERHLKRVLNQRGLFRRKTFNDLGVLVDFIRNQLQHSGQLHGYRWMYNLRDNGFFDGGFLDKNILQFCCMGLIQDELDDMALVWNSHLIRPSKNMNVPSGRPNVMYTLPELYGTRDFLSPVDDEQVQLCKSQCVFRLTMPCDPDVFALCAFLMSRSDLMPPKDRYQAVNLYLHLRAALTATL